MLPKSVVFVRNALPLAEYKPPPKPPPPPPAPAPGCPTTWFRATREAIRDTWPLLYMPPPKQKRARLLEIVVCEMVAMPTLNTPPPCPLALFPTIWHPVTRTIPVDQIPAPSVPHVLLTINELAIAIVPWLQIPPPLHSETVTPFNVAFPELQTPALGLATTDDELICRMPVDWIPPFVMTHPLIEMLWPFVTEPPIFNC